MCTANCQCYAGDQNKNKALWTKMDQNKLYGFDRIANNDES
jgi:hypothetical protein